MIDLTKSVTIDPTNAHVQWILRCMIFTTGPLAQTLRKLGHDIPRRAEDEQAAVLMWMLHVHAMHGDNWKAEGEKLLAEADKVCCFVHPDRRAVKRGNIPCAPGGGLWLCEECAKPESIPAVFEAYRASHQKNITAFKQTNPGS